MYKPQCQCLEIRPSYVATVSMFGKVDLVMYKPQFQCLEIRPSYVATVSMFGK